MAKCKYIPGFYGRTVGDPVDVVTGANVDVNRDFQLFGPLTLSWRRYYDSSKHRVLGALGWGHTHEYDRVLRFDADGVRYVRPVAQETGFPPLYRDGDVCHHLGVVLRRVSAKVFHLREQGELTLEFTLAERQFVARLTRVFDGPHALEFSYSETGQLQRIVDSLGRRIDVRTERDGRILELTLHDPEFKRTRPLLRCRYDRAGNLEQCVDPYNSTSSFKYDRENRLTTATDRGGYSFHYEYDETGRCVRSSGQDGLHEVRLRYLPVERATIVTKADGGQWQYFYNDQQVLTQVIDPLGGVTEYQLDEAGRAVAEIDAAGNVAPMVYDRGGGLLGKLSPLGTFVPLSESPNADRKEHIANKPLEWEYGSLVRREEITPIAPDDAPPSTIPPFAVRYIRREDSPPLSTSAQARPSATGGRRFLRDSKEFDECGLLLAQARPQGGVRRWSYTPSGYPARYHDATGAIYRYDYTSWNLLVRQVDPLGHVTSYRRSRSEQNEVVVDPGNFMHQFAYDKKDRVVELRRGGVPIESYRYTPGDAVLEKRDGAGEPLLKFEIGPANLAKGKQLASGDCQGFEYDKQGRLTLAKSGDAEVTFEYDFYGNRIADFSDGRGVRHVFNPHGLSLTTVLEKFSTRYLHRRDGALFVRDPAGAFHRISQLGHGIVVRAHADGSAEVSQYDRDGHCLAKVSRSRTGQRLRSAVYTYSPEGDLLRVQDTATGEAEYLHDAAHRLTTARVAGKETQFTYDAASNLLRQPGLDNVTLVGGNRLASANGDRFEYNPREQVASRHGPRRSMTFHYDSCDMLVRCETPAGEWTASYDALGRRVAKSCQGNRVEFVWDGDRLAAEINETGRLRVYVYADDAALTPLMFLEYDSVEADPADGRRYYVYCNQIGAPVFVEDDFGHVVWRAHLEPYGACHIDATSTIDFPLRFPGHYADDELGLHYNRFRYYSPELGRYVQPDPTGIDGGLNLYAYTPRPLTRVDVRGENDGCKHATGKGDPHGDDDGDGEGKRGPHELRVQQVDENGNVVKDFGTFKSGGTGVEDPDFQQQARVHTENKALIDINQHIQENGPIPPGHSIQMQGPYDPCGPNCQPRIKSFVDETGTPVVYHGEESGKVHAFTPTTDADGQPTGVRREVFNPDGSTNVTDYRPKPSNPGDPAPPPPRADDPYPPQQWNSSDRGDPYDSSAPLPQPPPGDPLNPVPYPSASQRPMDDSKAKDVNPGPYP